MAAQTDRRDKLFVSHYLSERCGLSIRELSPVVDCKTPDFEVCDTGQRVLIAELKTLHERRPSPEGGWMIEYHEDGTQIAHRPDNAPERVGCKIAEAHSQLRAHPHPWAIILLNRDYLIDARDFVEACSGQSVYKGPDNIRVINTASMRVALGKTRHTRYEVDLYLWIDAVRESRLSAWWSSPDGEDIARRYFSSAAFADSGSAQ